MDEEGGYMGQLTFNPEPGNFYFPAAIVKKDKVSGKKTRTKIKMDVKVTRVQCESSRFLALVYASRMHDDTDGAANSYGWDRPGDPLQTGLKPLDKLEDATHPHLNFKAGGNDFNWCGVVSATKAFAAAHHLKIDDRPRLCAKGEPYTDFFLPGEKTKLGEVGSYPIVQESGRTKGYYVSPNRVVLDAALKKWDPARYGNPLTFPFAVLTACWKGKNVLMHDIGWAINPANGNERSFLFGDANGSNALGECSRFMCTELAGGSADPVVIFVLFPGLRTGRIKGLKLTDMDLKVRGEIAKLNGIENGAEFAEFLSAGADLEQFERRRERPFNPRVLAPLSMMGYTAPIGDLSVPKGTTRAG
jgi:hypothetical protein